MNESTVQLKEAKTLPQGWQWVKLGDIAKIDTTQVLPETLEAGRLPYVGLEHVESETGRITGTLSGKSNASVQGTAFHFDSRHVLYGKLRPYLNKVALPDFEGRCSTELLPLLSVPECDRSYLAWLLRRSETVIEATRLMMGTRMPRADMDELFKLLVPLPPLPEQKRIAAKIQGLIAEVEHARTACEAQLEAAKALPQAYLRQVFESEEAKKWEMRSLGEVCEVITGNTPSKDVPEYYGNHLPWVKPDELDKAMYVVDTTERLSVLGASQARVLPRGAIMVSCIGNLGKVGIAGCELATNQQINSLVPGLGVHSEFMYFWCRTIRSALEKLAASTTLKIVNKSIFASIIIPLPELGRQQQIARELKDKITSAEKLRASIERELEAIKALPQAILRKAFRGEL